jgi:hypothetical protein
LLHRDNFNIELFNALHPATTDPAAKTRRKSVQAQIQIKRPSPKLRLAIDSEAERLGQTTDELVPALLRLGLKALQQGKALGQKNRKDGD